MCRSQQQTVWLQDWLSDWETDSLTLSQTIQINAKQTRKKIAGYLWPRSSKP